MNHQFIRCYVVHYRVIPITITIHTHMKQMTQNILNDASHSNQNLFMQVFFSVLIHIVHLRATCFGFGFLFIIDE
jgi:hypothetical protein